jgi:16S rRNA (uracil1498-N3)-methyltransferase
MNNKFHNFPRLFLPSSIENGQPIIIPENQSHYLKNVLRHVEGDLIRVFNPESGEYIGKITNIGKKHITIEIQNQIRSIEIETTEIHLFFSPIKKDRNDILIEKAVELGVTHFHPVLFARTIAREIKVERIHAQIIEAAEQCERLSIPTLAPLKEFKKALNEWDKDIPMMAAIERTDDTLLSKISLKTNRVGLCIGPEGGITEEEIEILKAKKFVTPVSFGKNILRAETAVFYGISILSTLFTGNIPPRL